MRFEPVYPKTPVFSCTCLYCEKTMRTDRDEVLADLDGKPFKAYYHAQCAAKVDPCATGPLT